MQADIIVLLVHKGKGNSLGIRLHSDDVTSHESERPRWRCQRAGAIPPVVADVQSDGDGDHAGFMANDEIVSVGGQTGLDNIEAVRRLRELQGTFTVAVARLPLASDSSGDVEEKELVIHKPWQDMKLGLELICLQGASSMIAIHGVRNASAADEAGLVTDDQIVSIRTDSASFIAEEYFANQQHDGGVDAALYAAKVLRDAVGDVRISVKRFLSASNEATAEESSVQHGSISQASVSQAPPGYSDALIGILEMSWANRMTSQESSLPGRSEHHGPNAWKRRSSKDFTRVPASPSVASTQEKAPDVAERRGIGKSKLSEALQVPVQTAQTVGRWAARPFVALRDMVSVGQSMPTMAA